MNFRFGHISILFLKIFIPGLMMLCSCNLTKYVPEGDKLFTGSKFVSDSIKLNKSTRKDLDKIARPKPNASFLGIRYRLMLFNAFKPTKKPRGIIYKIKNKWGQAPVLVSQARPKVTEQRGGDYLFSIGYLRPEITDSMSTKGKTASLVYMVNTGPRYTIRNIYYPKDTTGVNGWINRSQNKTRLRTGQYFVLADLSRERERIDEILKNNGYYFFSPDMLLFRVDSLHNTEADLYVTIKETAPAQALKPWWLGNITIYSNYQLQRDSAITSKVGEKGKLYTIVDPQSRYRTSVFENAIVIREHQIYRKNLHTLTIERLMNLQTFKFVKTAYFPEDDSIKPRLNTRIYLTPARKQTLKFEIAGNTKSNNFVGSELTINYKNINLQKGAEILEARLSGGFDIQLGGGQQLSSTAYTVTGEVNYYIPRFIPNLVKFKTGRNSYLPRTIFTPSVNYIRRPELYTLRSLSFAAGYNWKQGKAIEHTLRLINVNSIFPTDITPKFDSMLQQDVTLKAAFEKQLIIGTRYMYQYNNTFMAERRFTYALDMNFSSSGNLTNLFIKANPDTPQAKKILNLPVAQYLRLQIDLRGYWKLSSIFSWANRFIGGYAWAYGNSITVPYSEQFFIGGSSSIRAFRTRTLGPGSFHTDETLYQANESGEIKFEVNTELRYNMSKYLKLAAFIDAGNIWLRKDAPDKPGSGLDRGDFFNELAMGGGLGIRFDASVLVLRFDFATPFRKPWYPKGNRWVFNEMDIGSKAWRKENLLLNIGIGYPF